MILAVIFLIPFSQASGNFSLSSSPKCTVLSDCPKNFAACMNVTGLSEKRCVKDTKQICIGGMPDTPVKPCNRSRDCTASLERYSGWCDLETKFCCNVDPKAADSPFCPDRITPLYGQEKCKDVEKGMVYSGSSDQRGGLCYKGYSCPPKITRPTDLTFGSMTFRTNMDCFSTEKVDTKYNFMFCHNETDDGHELRLGGGSTQCDVPAPANFSDQHYFFYSQVLGLK
ncbi:uncharacterized protein CELE_F09E8.1 [Caenorhabditis elegans]|uniref:Domain of unknown function DX domain-containing protein n=1 Tax=Caenorhabditis elegans TaxID=6239 RepID=H2L2B6_CAEEL|nr:DX domain-containing protein [Caenorhabditis elegans]CCE71588.2 DX domain-containing protein [Caenorhabditis elegans]|eukprot:NP_001255702.1 Uncharacterized protein CELE_F09E8.1 [Caenorhabditis elegans]